MVDEVYCISDWGYDFCLDYWWFCDFIVWMFFDVLVLVMIVMVNSCVVVDVVE